MLSDSAASIRCCNNVTCVEKIITRYVCCQHAMIMKIAHANQRCGSVLSIVPAVKPLPDESRGILQLLSLLPPDPLFSAGAPPPWP